MTPHQEQALAVAFDSLRESAEAMAVQAINPQHVERRP